MTHAVPVCDLCEADGGELIMRGLKWRIILIHDAGYPGFIRVVWNDHVKEMTDLSSTDRLQLMRIVFEVEAVVRETMQPEKINVASLGNMTPHLHWHVIPRYRDDAHFPNPVWSAPIRETPAVVLQSRIALLDRLRHAIQCRKMDA